MNWTRWEGGIAAGILNEALIEMKTKTYVKYETVYSYQPEKPPRLFRVDADDGGDAGVVDDVMNAVYSRWSEREPPHTSYELCGLNHVV